MDRYEITNDLVKNLISQQFPDWNFLPLEPVTIQGWVNKIFRLGNRMLVRMPNGLEYAPKILKEQRWLPKLSPLLPFAIPQPIAMGKPDENYPYPWYIYKWIEGDSAVYSSIFDAKNIALNLAQFINALNNIESSFKNIN